MGGSVVQGASLPAVGAGPVCPWLLVLVRGETLLPGAAAAGPRSAPGSGRVCGKGGEGRDGRETSALCWGQQLAREHPGDTVGGFSLHCGLAGAEKP